MAATPANPPKWLLAMESSTAQGGCALLADGEAKDAFLLEEGLRHGRELIASAAALLRGRGLKPADLHGVAVSVGPGSYTGLRVGVMAAKALAWGSGVRLLAASSLAALAQTMVLRGAATDGDCVFAAQDARRDEVYVGFYRIENGLATAERKDAAMTPEEAATMLADREKAAVRRICLAGSAFATYSGVMGGRKAEPGRVDPAAVGQLGWRQSLLEETADPMLLQPVYLRRDADADWRHDHLIS